MTPAQNPGRPIERGRPAPREDLIALGSVNDARR